MLTQKTVLLVEDDVDDQDLFVEALAQITHVTLFGIARNGKEAIERLHRKRDLPSMIFMDINMPVMNGLECLKELAKDFAINAIPIIMLSSSVEHRHLVRFLGASAFIAKPNSIETLRLELEKVIHPDLAVGNLLAMPHALSDTESFTLIKG